MKKVAVSLVSAFIAAAALSACEKETTSDEVIVVDEPCEDKGTCEPTD